MKRLVSICFILLLSAQCIFKLSIVAYFEANREYIAEVLCVNKEKPITMCYGQCFLDRNLSLADDLTSQDSSAPTKAQVETSVFVNHAFEIELSNTNAEVEQTEKPVVQYQSSDLATPFHPPQA